MILDIGLPLALAFIMFSLGLGLHFADFGRVLRLPKPALTGIVAQLVLLPLVAYALIAAWGFAGGMAFGIMLLAFSPGGVTSNMLTKLAGGTVALSITLTAVVSLLSVLTLPVLVAWAAVHFMGEAAPEISVVKVGVAMFVITALPVFLGLLIRRYASGFASAIERGCEIVALILFVLIVAAAIASNWALLTESFARLGPFLIVLNLVLLGVGIGLARLMGIAGRDGLAIAVEMGVQNATVGITIANIVGASTGLSEFAVPSAVYGICMYIVNIPALLVLRRVFAQAA